MNPDIEAIFQAILNGDHEEIVALIETALQDDPECESYMRSMYSVAILAQANQQPALALSLLG